MFYKEIQQTLQIQAQWCTYRHAAHIKHIQHTQIKIHEIKYSYHSEIKKYVE